MDILSARVRERVGGTRSARNARDQCSAAAAWTTHPGRLYRNGNVDQSPAEEAPGVDAVGGREDGKLLVRRQELVPARRVVDDRRTGVRVIRPEENALGIGEFEEADELAARRGHGDVEVCTVSPATAMHAQKSLTSCWACSSDVAFCICATFGCASICRMRVC